MLQLDMTCDTKRMPELLNIIRARYNLSGLVTLHFATILT